MAKKTKTILISVLIIGLVTSTVILLAGGIIPLLSIKNTVPKEWKLGIMISTLDEDNEVSLLVKRIEAEYGSDKIWLTNTEYDRWVSHLDHINKTFSELAADPLIKAIIISRGIPGIAEEVERIREIRPDILIIVGSPQDNLQTLIINSDIIIDTDDLGRGRQIAEHASKMGAEVIVHYSFPRHMELQALEARHDLMEKTAEELNIRFVYVDAPDPTEHGGVELTQQFIKDDVRKQIEEHGSKTAFFGTNCAMMEPLITEVLEHGGIFLVQCCPGPYHILPDALDIDILSNKGDASWVIAEINNEINKRNSNDRIATWPITTEMMVIQAGTDYAIDWIHGRIKSRNDDAALKAIMESITNVGVTLTNADGDADNYYLFLPEHYIFGKKD